MLSTEPQGGFITRRPSADVLIASDDVQGDNGFGFFNFPRDPAPQTGNTRRRGSGQYYRPMQPGWW